MELTQSNDVNTVAAREVEPIESSVREIYKARFPAEVQARRQAVWQVLCRDWFARYVPANARVLEVAPGYCEFINNIEATEKVGVDLNPDCRTFASPGITIHEAPAETLPDIVPAGYFDVAFMSNFLEHCRTRDQMLAVLRAWLHR